MVFLLTDVVLELKCLNGADFGPESGQCYSLEFLKGTTTCFEIHHVCAGKLQDKIGAISNALC